MQSMRNWCIESLVYAPCPCHKTFIALIFEPESGFEALSVYKVNIDNVNPFQREQREFWLDQSMD